MDQVYYRGGNDLTPKPNELRLDPDTGFVLPTRGISLNSDPAPLARFGDVYRVKRIPDDLEIVQQGRNPNHYELRPKYTMRLDCFFDLLGQVELEQQP